MAKHKNSVYGKISEDIASKIKNKHYLPGNALEPERKLMEIYGVERTTIRRALDLLVKDGLVVKKTGLGTFVSDGTDMPVAEAVSSAPAQAPVKKYTRKNLPEAVKFLPDFSASTLEIFDNLSALGHEKIIGIVSNSSKFASMCGEAAKRGLYDSDLFTLSGKRSVDDVFVLAWRAVRGAKPTAIIVENESDAKAVTETAERMRISVPNELSVMVLNKVKSSEFSGCYFDASLEKEVLKMLENVPDNSIPEMTVLLKPIFEKGNTASQVKRDRVGSGTMSSFLL